MRLRCTVRYSSPRIQYVYQYCTRVLYVVACCHQCHVLHVGYIQYPYSTLLNLLPPPCHHTYPVVLVHQIGVDWEPQGWWWLFLLEAMAGVLVDVLAFRYQPVYDLRSCTVSIRLAPGLPCPLALELERARKGTRLGEWHQVNTLHARSASRAAYAHVPEPVRPRDPSLVLVWWWWWWWWWWCGGGGKC